MKRTSVVLASVVACGAFATSVSAGPQRDAATGGGQSGVGTSIAFSAHQGPDGDAKGHVVLKNKQDATRGETQGHVTCVEAVGNVATIVYQVDKSDGNVAEVGQYRKVRVEDNGEPRKGQPVDTIRGGPVTDAPQDCSPIDPPFAGVIMRGNLRVVDGG